MADLLGIIAPLKKFLSNTNEEIIMSVEGKKSTVLTLKEGRIYNIPDFQREIRWTSDNVSVLVEDIKSGAKFLGNIILTKHSESLYSIIDGQQRITVLSMVLNCIRLFHQEEIDVIMPCRLTIDSFLAFEELMDLSFKKDEKTKKMVAESDKLKQAHKYFELWNYISDLEEVKDRRQAKKFLSNLGSSNLNIIINESDDVSEGIRYFIDVNLKGKQLDTEDIFKSYLFINDPGREIREKWYLLKTTAANVEASKMEYPLLKMLEHYFYCDLYLCDRYKGMEFGTDFLLKKRYKPSDNTYIYREGTHLIEVIDDKKYMRDALDDINTVIGIMLNIVSSVSITDDFKKVFMYTDSHEREKNLDDTELKIIHNILGKILRDSKIAPKALVMKYLLLVILRENNKQKEDLRQVYGVYLFSVLFMIFENKKSTEVLMGVLRAKADAWYNEMIKQIYSYFSVGQITDSRILAQYKLGRNEEEEDYRFKCKSLATVYNYFAIVDRKVRIKNGLIDELYKFINDENAYSLEHFIISESSKRIIKGDAYFDEYEIEETVYKKYVNNIFNFIFLDKDTNSMLSNLWLPSKLDRLKNHPIKCEYSNMIVSKLDAINEEFKKRVKVNYKDNLYLFFARDFKDMYISYGREVLESVIEKIKNECAP
nr:DUF262 domain-containing protein [uncultured Acetatifactor sp.]